MPPALPHDLPFDPTYGYTLDSLKAVGSPDPPDDFEAFWRSTHAATRAIAPAITQRRVEPIDADHDVFEIEFDTLGGRCGGWLIVPHRPAEQGIVVGHGYGGRESPELLHFARPTVAIFPCARGFNRSRTPGVPDTSARHVLHGIASRETYIHRFNVAELWSAATALLELFPHVAARLFYWGGSFGGGIGAMMLPWDGRFARAFLSVPSFGNHPLRVTLPCTGSGAAVKLQHERRGNVLPVLRYFDAATAARFIRTPTMVAAALFDPAVPPPGQFAVYNAIPAEKQLFVRTSGHFGFEGEADERQRFEAAARRWLEA